MKIITRYILKQFFVIFLIALFIMMSAMTIYAISEATIKWGLPLYVAVRLIPCSVPYELSIMMPVAALLGCTLSYAKMVGSNELIALKAMGVPPWRVFIPAWIVTFLMSLLSVWCNDLTFSWGYPTMARVVISGTEEMILGKLADEGKFSDIQNNFVLNVGRVEKSGELSKIHFTIHKPFLKGEAEQGRLTVDVQRTPPIVRIELDDLLVESDNAMLIQPDIFVREIPLDQFKSGSFSTSIPSMKNVKKVLAEIQGEREKIRRKFAARGTFALIKGDFDYFQDREWIERWHQENGFDYRYNRTRLAIPRAWSSGFSCFFFAWVGIPLAVWLNCSDYITSFFVCFIPTLVIYYPLLMFGLSGAKSGMFPPMICWLGNVVLGLIGIWILKKIHYH